MTVPQVITYNYCTQQLHNNMYCRFNLLAGIWPCGVITIIDELYKTESESQVYGWLHGFIHSNPINTSSIGKLTQRYCLCNYFASL